MGLRLKIRHEVSGTWSVYGLSSHPVMHLPSLSASLDYARRECAGAPATVELLIDGFYAVIHQENGWPRWPLISDTKRPQLAGRGASYSDAGSAARSRSSWFIEFRAWAIRLIAALASGFVDMKRSKSAFLSTSSRQ
jgi:hypothetical protein